MPTKKRRQTVQLPPRVHARLKRLAKRDGKTLAEMVNLSLAAYDALRASWKATP